MTQKSKEYIIQLTLSDKEYQALFRIKGEETRAADYIVGLLKKAIEEEMPGYFESGETLKLNRSTLTKLIENDEE